MAVIEAVCHSPVGTLDVAMGSFAILISLVSVVLFGLLSFKLDERVRTPFRLFVLGIALFSLRHIINFGDNILWDPIYRDIPLWVRYGITSLGMIVLLYSVWRFKELNK